MKKILSIIAAAAMSLPLCACSLTEKPAEIEVTAEKLVGNLTDVPQTDSVSVKDLDKAEISAPEVSETTESQPEHQAEPQPERQPERQPEPVFLDDIHDWADGNYLYNINITFNRTDRYYREFTRAENPSALWTSDGKALTEKYDSAAAAEFAKAHWNDGLDVCAPFISRCLKAGGLSIGSDSSTSLCLMLSGSRLGFGQFLPINEDTTVTLPDYARPGDVVQTYCSCEGLMIHSLMFVGNDENGLMKVCCHNSRNSGEYAFRCGSRCYACGAPLKEVFFYHFYNDGEKPPKLVERNSGALICESTEYAIHNQTYDRKKAVEYIKEHPLDGIGQFGAQNLSAAFSAGGIDVNSPVQTALFMQLMKSRHGAFRTVPINPDRTVTLPKDIEEGDVCFLYCSEEAMFYSSFLIKGADADGKMIGYSFDKVNSDKTVFKVESVCPSSVCDSEITEVMLYHFE